MIYLLAFLVGGNVSGGLFIIYLAITDMFRQEFDPVKLILLFVGLAMIGVTLGLLKWCLKSKVKENE